MIRTRRRKNGFTLVELLVVVAIIGILMGMLFPAVQAVRNAARRSTCLNNLRQMIIAAQTYQGSNFHFPNADDGAGTSFHVPLLPYMEQIYLFDRYHEDLGPSETIEQRLAELCDSQVDVFLCPSAIREHIQTNVQDHGATTTHYYGVAGPIGTASSSDGTKAYNYQEIMPIPTGGAISLDGFCAPNKNGLYDGTTALSMQDIVDGASNTLAFGEISRQDPTTYDRVRAGWAFGASYVSSGSDGSIGEIENLYSAKSIRFGINVDNPAEVNIIPFSSNHLGGAQFAFVDGSTRYINQNVDRDIIKIFASRKSREKPERLISE